MRAVTSLVKAAKTKYMVTVHDNMGNVLPNPAADRIFGGWEVPILRAPASSSKASVSTDAGDCGGEPENMLDGYWTVGHLISDIPTASSGAKDFAGLDAMLDPMKNATPGFIKFTRGGLTCKDSHGDGDTSIGDGDGVPPIDDRTYTGWHADRGGDRTQTVHSSPRGKPC